MPDAQIAVLDALPCAEKQRCLKEDLHASDHATITLLVLGLAAWAVQGLRKDPHLDLWKKILGVESVLLLVFASLYYYFGVWTLEGRYIHHLDKLSSWLRPAEAFFRWATLVSLGAWTIFANTLPTIHIALVVFFALLLMWGGVVAAGGKGDLSGQFAVSDRFCFGAASVNAAAIHFAPKSDNAIIAAVVVLALSLALIGAMVKNAYDELRSSKPTLSSGGRRSWLDFGLLAIVACSAFVVNRVYPVDTAPIQASSPLGLVPSHAVDGGASSKTAQVTKE